MSFPSTSYHKDKIKHFIDLTGTNEEFAYSFLQANNFQLETSVNLFLESKSDLNQNPNSFSSPSHKENKRYKKVFEEKIDEIRPPKKHMTEKLIQDIPTITNLTPDPFRNFAVESGPSWNIPGLSALFRPPTEYNFNGNFEEVCHYSSSVKKWLLVNIQSNQLFDSHRLNRDTWSHPKIHSLLTHDFILWQKQHDSHNGSYYCSFYHPSSLPHIGLIDPRTKELIGYWNGYTSAEKLILAFSDFLCDNNFDNPSINKDSILHNMNIYDLSDHELMKVTISESLLNNNSPIEKKKKLPNQYTVVLESDVEDSEDSGDSGDSEIEIVEKTKPLNVSKHISLISPDRIEVIKPDGDDKERKDRGSIITSPPPLSPEPEKGQEITRISVKVASGVSLKRRFKIYHPISKIYQWIKEELVKLSLPHQNFTLFTSSNPKKALDNHILTVQQAQILNMQLILEYT